VDDKPRILAAVKDAWGDHVTTILPRQGKYARDAKAYRRPICRSSGSAIW